MAREPKNFDNLLGGNAKGLSDAQLKTIAGARPSEKTPGVTRAGITVCCWG